MFKLFSYLSLILLGVTAQISPIRDPALTFAPPTVATFVPIRTIGPIRTIPIITSSTRSITSTSTSTITNTNSFTTTTIDSISQNDTTSESEDLTLVYALVPSGVVLLLLFLAVCMLKRKKKNNVVNIDLNIENNIINRQQSAESGTRRLSNHIYEEVDYEARYEMPTIGGDRTYVNEGEYGKQVTTIV